MYSVSSFPVSSYGDKGFPSPSVLCGEKCLSKRDMTKRCAFPSTCLECFGVVYFHEFQNIMSDSTIQLPVDLMGLRETKFHLDFEKRKFRNMTGRDFICTESFADDLMLHIKDKNKVDLYSMFNLMCVINKVSNIHIGILFKPLIYTMRMLKLKNMSLAELVLLDMYAMVWKYDKTFSGKIDLSLQRQQILTFEAVHNIRDFVSRNSFQ